MASHFPLQMRQSNLELCRIASILLVVLVHSNYRCIAWPQDYTLWSIPPLFTEAFAIVGVNVFVLITGYFSTNPKLKSIINLFYICAFYAVFRLVTGYATDNFDKSSIMFITKSNWFIVSYLGLLLLTPILNMFVENVNKCKLGGVILLMLLYEFYFGWFPAMAQVNPGFGYGYSVLSFIIIYLIGRYLRLYPIHFFNKKTSLTIYILCSIVIGFMALFLIYRGQASNIFMYAYAYNNPVVLLSSIGFFMFFVNLRIGNKKWINYIAQSCLAVLLVHGSSSCNFWMNDYFCRIYNDYGGLIIIPLWIAGLLVVFAFSVFVDQFRLLSYNYIQKYLYNTTLFNNINEKFNKIIN